MLAIWFNRHRRIPIGRFLLAVNVVIINIAAFVFSLEKAMLSLAVYYIVAKNIFDLNRKIVFIFIYHQCFKLFHHSLTPFLNSRIELYIYR